MSDDTSEPVLSFVPPIHSIQLYQDESGMWIIRETESGVTTQGETKYEALLMLADALAAHNDANIDLLDSAEDIFTLSEEQREWLKSEGIAPDR